MGSFSCKFFDWLNGLPLSQVPVLYVYSDIFEAWQKDHISCGWITTLKFVNFGLMQFAEFLHCHLHLIPRWIYSRIKPGLFLRIFSGSRCKSLLRVQSKMHMAWLTVQYPCGFIHQLIFEMWPACSQNVLRNSRGVHYTCTLSGIYHTRQYIKCLPLHFLNVRCWMRSRHFWDPTLSRIACSFSSRVERHLISSDWDFISSACCRCKWDRTDTCVQWAISSSIMSANKASLP